jgi:hypothetical protein
MPQRWIVEHPDDDGIIDIFHYDHGHIAKDVAEQMWTISTNPATG